MPADTYTSHPTLMRLILETAPESGAYEMLACNTRAHHVKFKSSEQFRFIRMGLEEAPESGLLYRVEADSVVVVKPVSESEAVVFVTTEPERYGIVVEDFILDEAAICTDRQLKLVGEIKHTPFPMENGMGVKLCRDLEKRGLIHAKTFSEMGDQQRWRAKEAWNEFINDKGTSMFWVDGPSQDWLDAHAGEPPVMDEASSLARSIAKSFSQAGSDHQKDLKAWREATDQLPDGAVVNGWRKTTIAGDVFWNKGSKHVANVVVEVGQAAVEKVLKQAGLMDEAKLRQASDWSIWGSDVFPNVGKRAVLKSRSGERVRGVVTAAPIPREGQPMVGTFIAVDGDEWAFGVKDFLRGDLKFESVAQRATLRDINREIKRKGVPGELVKGRGYFYMADLDNEDYFWSSHTDSIHVYSLAQMNLAQWVDRVVDLYQTALEESVKLNESTIRVTFRNDNEIHFLSGEPEDITAFARAISELTNKRGKVKFNQDVSPFTQNKTPLVVTVMFGFDTPQEVFWNAEDLIRNVWRTKLFGKVHVTEAKVGAREAWDNHLKEPERKTLIKKVDGAAGDERKNWHGLPDHLKKALTKEIEAKGLNNISESVLNELQMNPASIRNPLKTSDVGDKKRVVGGFRFRVGGGKKRPRKDIQRSIQGKRNARRGLAKRIRAVKKFHKSPQGQRLHRALGRFNATNRTNEHRESPMRFRNGSGYCEGRVYVWGINAGGEVSTQSVSPGLAVEDWCKQYSVHGAAYIGEKDIVLSTFNSLLSEKQEAKVIKSFEATGLQVSVYDDAPDYAMVEQVARLSRVINTGVKKREGLWSVDEGYAIWLPSSGLHLVPALERVEFVPLLGESYASINPAWLMRDSRKDERLWNRDVVIGTDAGDQLVTIKASAYVSEAHEARFVASFKPGLKTKDGTIRHLDVPLMSGVSESDLPKLREEGKLDGFESIFEKQFSLTEDETGVIGLNDPFGVEDTLDDVFDDILGILVVSGYLDLLQDVEFDDEYGSILLYFDPSAAEEELADILNGLDGENPGTSLIGTPAGVMPGESQESDWWVVFVPGAEGAPIPDISMDEDESGQTGFDGMATSDNAVGKVVAQIDVGAALNAASGK